MDTMERSQEEVAEIERHKYFLSEKAGYDVGWDHAVADWETNHAAEYRGDSPNGDSSPPNGKGISMLFRKLFNRQA